MSDLLLLSFDVFHRPVTHYFRTLSYFSSPTYVIQYSIHCTNIRWGKKAKGKGFARKKDEVGKNKERERDGGVLWEEASAF